MQPVQLRMARAALDLSIDELAAKAGLAPSEIARMEEGTDGGGESAQRVRAMFEGAGIEWIDQNGVRLKEAPDGTTIPLEDLSSANDE